MASLVLVYHRRGRIRYAQQQTLSTVSDYLIIGVLTDIIIYSIITPVLPFRLEGLGYTGVSALVGWLLFSYVSLFQLYLDAVAGLTLKTDLVQSAGLVICQCFSA